MEFQNMEFRSSTGDAYFDVLKILAVEYCKAVWNFVFKYPVKPWERLGMVITGDTLQTKALMTGDFIEVMVTLVCVRTACPWELWLAFVVPLRMMLAFTLKLLPIEDPLE